MPRRNPKTASRIQSGRLRIVAGKWRSRLVDIADVPGLRPTSARVRETLFNWLAPTIAGSRCLDLCAGTGALGLEALSRGAASCVFVDPSRKATDTLHRNLAILEANNARVYRGCAEQFITAADGHRFDIVFIDPPFAADLQARLCRLLADSSRLAPAARIYLEEAADADQTELPEHWQMLREGRAGRVRYRLIDTQVQDEGDET